MTNDRGYVIEATWHGLANYEVVPHIGAEQVAEILGWDWRRLPVYFTMKDDATGDFILDDDGNTKLFEIPNKKVFVNSLTMAAPGLHSDGYTCNQPDMFVEIAEVLIEHGFTVASVGTIQDSAKWFLSAEMPSEFTFELNGKEMVLSMINIGDSIDGKSRLLGANAQRRIVCANTYKANLLGVPHAFAIKHTQKGALEASALARNLEAALVAQKTINETVERLIETSLTEAEFVKITKAVMGDRPTDEGRGRTMWDNQFDSIIKGSYYDSNLDGIRETAYGAIMAGQHHDQHKSIVRGSKGKPADRLERTIERVIFTDQDFAQRFANQVFATIG
jgi:phage/plasmid-like protein (TIGR03299 family)